MPTRTAKGELWDIAYELYCEYDLPTIQNPTPYLKEKGWLVQTGLSIIPPHPHRHYTWDEFMDKWIDVAPRSAQGDKEYLDFVDGLFGKAKKEYFDRKNPDKARDRKINKILKDGEGEI